MSHVRRLQQHTYADYVAVEQTSSGKHEFYDGQIYAMAGGSEEHSALAAEVLRALGNALGNRPCRTHTSDLRIYVEAAGLATFPDGAVICGPLEQHGASPRATALNPIILLEVTSDSSEDYDTGMKFELYQMIPSLREYVVVSHRERRIVVHRRMENNQWHSFVAVAQGSGTVERIEAELHVDTIYRGSSIA